MVLLESEGLGSMLCTRLRDWLGQGIDQDSAGRNRACTFGGLASPIDKAFLRSGFVLERVGGFGPALIWFAACCLALLPNLVSKTVGGVRLYGNGCRLG